MRKLARERGWQDNASFRATANRATNQKAVGGPRAEAVKPFDDRNCVAAAAEFVEAEFAQVAAGRQAVKVGVGDSPDPSLANRQVAHEDEGWALGPTNAKSRQQAADQRRFSAAEPAD